jgi:hypothetical protein
MTNKKIAKLSVGTRIQVRTGVHSPEMPDVECDGWSGTIVDTSGKKADPKYIIEWDQVTLESLTTPYVEKCEEMGLYYRMACFEGTELEPVAA